MLRAESRERRARAGGDLGRGSTDVFQPELDLVLDAAEDDLVLGVLEHGRDPAGQVGRPRAARVEAADLDLPLEAAAVEMRNEPRERAHERGLPGAGRAEHGHELARLELERDIPQRRPAPRIGEGQVLDLS